MALPSSSLVTGVADFPSSVSSFGERTLELLLAFNGFGLKDDAREKRGRRPFVGGDDW